MATGNVPAARSSERAPSGTNRLGRQSSEPIESLGESIRSTHRTAAVASRSAHPARTICGPAVQGSDPVVAGLGAVTGVLTAESQRSPGGRGRHLSVGVKRQQVASRTNGRNTPTGLVLQPPDTLSMAAMPPTGVAIMSPKPEEMPCS
jgi:hypothetical protein